MRAEIHSLNWPKSNPLLSQFQSNVFRHFDIPLIRHTLQKDHGEWLDSILSTSQADVILFIDNDCVPIKKEAVIDSILWAASNHSFLGIAQASNHINNGTHIFAAPAFLAISTQAWRDLGEPSLKANSRGDVAEELSWRAEERGLTYRAWYPTHFSRPAQEGIWRLSNYGIYGIGTIFAGKVFHLYQGRLNTNVELFREVCDQICLNRFSTNGMHSCFGQPNNH